MNGITCTNQYMRWLKNNSNSSAMSVVWCCSLKLHERILISNVFIGLTTVPIYIVLKSFPFFIVFGAGILTTLSVLILFFYFLGAKFVGTWAILQKFAVTLPTSFVLSHIVKLLPINPLLDYIILFVVGYVISTPLIFLTYNVTKWLYGKKR